MISHSYNVKNKLFLESMVHHFFFIFLLLWSSNYRRPICAYADFRILQHYHYHAILGCVKKPCKFGGKKIFTTFPVYYGSHTIGCSSLSSKNCFSYYQFYYFYPIVTKNGSLPPLSSLVQNYMGMTLEN